MGPCEVFMVIWYLDIERCAAWYAKGSCEMQLWVVERTILPSKFSICSHPTGFHAEIVVIRYWHEGISYGIWMQFLQVLATKPYVTISDVCDCRRKTPSFVCRLLTMAWTALLVVLINCLVSTVTDLHTICQITNPKTLHCFEVNEHHSPFTTSCITPFIYYTIDIKTIILGPSLQPLYLTDIAMVSRMEWAAKDIRNGIELGKGTPIAMFPWPLIFLLTPWPRNLSEGNSKHYAQGRVDICRGRARSLLPWAYDIWSQGQYESFCDRNVQSVIILRRSRYSWHDRFLF